MLVWPQCNEFCPKPGNLRVDPQSRLWGGCSPGWHLVAMRWDAGAEHPAKWCKSQELRRQRNRDGKREATWGEELTHWKRPWCWERLMTKGEGAAEDEMVGWHYRLNGRESEWTPEVGDGQGGLACCDSWGRKESDTTELNWTEWDMHAIFLRCAFLLNLI